MSIPTASILLIGNELLNGDTRDINANFIALKLSELGISLKNISVVKDDLEDITNELNRLSSFSETIFTSGGIGPTSDDITREAIAKLIGKELEQREEAVIKLENYMKKHNRPLNKNTFRQAMFPISSEIIPNVAGTADAFLTKHKKTENKETGYENTNIITLPGVPKEVQSIFEKEVEPNITNYFSSFKKLKRKNLRIFGLSESFIGTELDSLNLEVSVAYRPSFPELLLVLTSDCEQNGEEKLEQAKNKITNKIGEEFFYSEVKKERLANAVFKTLKDKELTVSFAESCTGGMLSESIVNQEGASSVFKGSVVSYSNESKINLLDVDSIESTGAVSEETSKQMAKSVLDKFKSDFAISVTGIAGPDGGSAEKPVGTVFIAIADKNSVEAYKFNFNWGRQRNRIYSTSMAWDLLRRKILGFPMVWDKK